VALVLDIETVPLSSAADAPYPEDRQPPANYKSAETIAKWKEQDRLRWVDERIKKASLNARLGRVLCLGWAASGETHEDKQGVIYAETEDREADLLRAFWNLVADHNGAVVTWNGTWDLRFLTLRSLDHGLIPTLPPNLLTLWFKRYRTQPHFDCKAVLLNWDVIQSGEGLNEWAKFFGVPGKTDGLSGGDVYPLFAGGMHDEVAEYCLADVLATKAIYHKMLSVFGSAHGVKHPTEDEWTTE
jgi:hypothetical protein